MLGPVGLCGQNSKLDSLETLLATEMHDTVRAGIYYELGEIHLDESQSKAMEYFYRSMHHAEPLGDIDRVVRCMAGISDIHVKLAEYDQALEVVKDALVLAGEDKDLVAYCHNRLSIVYSRLENYSLSRKSDLLALKNHTMLGDTINMAYDVHNIGSYYLGVGNLDSAIIEYQLSNQYLRGRHHILKAHNHNRLGFAYTYMGDYDKAIVHHKEALELYARDSLKEEMAYEENYIASVYFNKRDAANTFKHAENAEKYARGINNYELHKSNCDLMCDFYVTIKKDYKKALEYTNLLTLYKDSVVSENKKKILESIEVEHKFENQKRALLSSEESNFNLKKQRIRLVVLTSVLIVLLLASTVVIVQRKREHQKNLKLAKDLDKANQSLRSLLSVIGHDLRDSIGNLKNFTQLMHYELLDNKSIKEMVVKSVPMVDSTHGLLDTILTWTKNSDEHFEPVKEKLSAEHIVRLSVAHTEHIANTKQVKIVTDVQDIMFLGDKNMMLTVLRNLIGNAVKFSESGSEVKIRSRSNNGKVDISVIDKGVGMNKQQIENILLRKDVALRNGTEGEKGSGLGLSLCSSFLDKHGAILDISSVEGEGSVFKFSVPKN